MIKGSLLDERQNGIMPPGVFKALAVVKRCDRLNLREGRIDLGDGIFLIVSSYDTIIAGDTIEVEGHFKYIDVQILISGEEEIGVLPGRKVPHKSQYNEERDYWNGLVTDGEMEKILLGKDDYLVLFPEDAHAPQLAVHGYPQNVKKIVAKVPVKPQI
jgi:biofilm protein TabA